MNQPGFAGRISDATAARGEAGKRSNVDDAARFVPPEFRCERPGEQERSAKVRLVDTIPNLRRKRVKVSEGDANVPRRVIHEDVDPAEMTNHLLKAEFDRFAVSLIELHGVALPASPSHRLHYRTSTASLAYIGNNDIRAGGSKCLRNCSPNVAGASGNERNFSIEIHGAPPSPDKRQRQRRKHIPFGMGRYREHLSTE
jgi:hypothetical protein